MFWESKDGLKYEFLGIIDSLYNNDCNNDYNNPYLNTPIHLNISHVYSYINPKQKIEDTWEDTCMASPSIITETININDMVEQVLKDYIPGLNYIMCIYEENKNQKYMNIFNVWTKEHIRIEIIKDLKIRQFLYTLNIPEYILKYQNIKNIHKDIKYILKKFEFKTIDIMPEVLTLIL